MRAFGVDNERIFSRNRFRIFASNLFKIKEGAWIPLAFGTLVFCVMVSWNFGFEAMRRRHTVLTETPDEFFLRLTRDHIPRVPGTAVFLTRLATTTPFLIVEHVAQMRAMYETAIALTVNFESIPRVASRDRIELAKLAEGFWHITVHFGFIQTPDIPAALRLAKARGCPVDLEHAIYFGARHAVNCSKSRNWLVCVRPIVIFAFLCGVDHRQDTRCRATFERTFQEVHGARVGKIAEV